MAQDFHAAFGLGATDTAIPTVDADGVALAAIQGLNEKVESGKQKAKSLEQRLEQKETEITELRQTVSELKELVQAMNLKLNGGAR
jgi:peptidoglycan hydrolase CwlO-like protein